MKPVTAATPCTTPAHAPAPARRAVATCAPVALAADALAISADSLAHARPPVAEPPAPTKAEALRRRGRNTIGVVCGLFALGTIGAMLGAPIAMFAAIILSMVVMAGVLFYNHLTR